MLRVSHVYKKYSNTNNILKDVSISFPDKGFISILGSSGSGKSTLLNLIGGLDHPSKGYIYLNNRDISSFSTKELNWYHDKYVSFVFQQYNLIEYLTVKDNLKLVSSKYMKELKQLGISYLENKKVRDLSGGEKQRVALARCILKNPKVLLCDEPTGALDSTNSIFIMDLLKKISKNKLVIVITHNEELANTYSDNIIRIKDGRVNNTIKVNNDNDHINIKKVKHKNIFNIIYNHLKNKWRRNLLISLSFSIGLLALGLVLSITNGFQKSLEVEEKNTLAKYPIVISKTSSNVEEELTKEFNGDNNKVYSYDINHINNINKDYINYLDNLDNHLDYKLYKYVIDNHIINISMINDNGFINQFNTIYGTYTINDNEVLLILDNNNRINKYDMESIGLNDNTYNYEELIGYKYKIKKNTYTIKGIIKANNDSIFNDLSGILYNNHNFINNIPDEIYLYPKDYNNKLELINNLKLYKDIKYQDISTSIKNISNTLIDGVRLVLIVFSIITLIVSTILISILTYINIMEYKYEIGIYKSLGMKDSNIKLIFYLENIIIVLLSNIITFISILFISVPLNNLINNLTGLSNVININILTINIIMVISVLLSIISSAIPIKNISKLNIIDIFKTY